MKWETRKITWGDLNASVGLVYAGRNLDKPYYVTQVSRNGQTKVHVSLKGCSFVMKSFWIKKFNGYTPELKTMFIMEISRILRRTVHKVKAYEQP